MASSFNGPVSITLSPNPHGGALGGTLTATATNGWAVFSGLTLDTAGSGYTIEASSGKLGAVTGGPIVVAPAAAAGLVVSIPPPFLMTAGADFGLAIAAIDPYGNIATSFAGNVTIALASAPGSAILVGEPLTIAATAGVANFHATLTLETAAQGYTLQAASDGLTPVTTRAITVTSGPATRLVVISQPPSLVVPGSRFGLVVAAEDPFGNIDSNFGGQVSLAPTSSAGATLAGNASITASKGVASFSGLMMSTATPRCRSSSRARDSPPRRRTR